VDDRLPTRDGKLIYLKSKDEGEFWGALLEKAYAKWYGSYRTLAQGNASEASVDLTGGIPETIHLAKSRMSPQRIFHTLLDARSKGSILCCTITVRISFLPEPFLKMFPGFTVDRGGREIGLGRSSGVRHHGGQGGSQRGLCKDDSPGQIEKPLWRRQGVERRLGGWVNGQNTNFYY